MQKCLVIEIQDGQIAGKLEIPLVHSRCNAARNEVASRRNQSLSDGPLQFFSLNIFCFEEQQTQTKGEHCSQCCHILVEM